MVRSKGELYAGSGEDIMIYYYWKKKYETRAGERGFLPVVVDKPLSAKVNTITIQYADGTHLLFEGNVDSSVLKQLLPVFAK